MSKKILVGATALATLVIVPSVSASVTATFNNPAPITINDATAANVPTPASPYPSSVMVGRVAALKPMSSSSIITDNRFTVTLRGVSHTSPADLDVRLVGFGGATLLDNAGGTDVPVSNADLTFDTTAATTARVPAAGPMVSGVFRPSLYGTNGITSSFGTTLLYKPGTYSLYVADDDPGDTGVIARGFSVDYTYTPDNAIGISAKTRNRKRGTVQFLVRVLNPGILTLSGSKTVKGTTVNVPVAGKFPLTIRAKGKALKALKRKGKAYVNAVVTFTPTGGSPKREIYDSVQLSTKKRR